MGADPRRLPALQPSHGNGTGPPAA